MVTVKSLKKWLEKIPNNYELDLSQIFILKGEEDIFECTLDNPIVAIVDSKEHKHFRFMIQTKDLDKSIKALGKLKRIK
jgi:hypothetical protein